jgi:hypothetical protein
LNQFGFNEILIKMMKKVIEPISKALFPKVMKNDFQSHHSFLIKYKIGEDISLKTHVDQSDITLNLCLGKEFTGGEVYFKGLKGEKEEKYFEYQSVVGNAILHVGNHVRKEFFKIVPRCQ